MGVSWDRDDDLIEVERPLLFRGAVYGLLFTACFGLICGAVLFFVLNGWSFR